MNKKILGFLEAIDAALVPFAQSGERLNLYLLGRCVLIPRQGVRVAT